jgi:hypothetical protein
MSSPPLPRQVDEILAPTELAKLLKVQKTVYTMAEGAEVRRFKVRDQWGFRRRDINE